MGKSSKSQQRRERIERLEKQRKAAERRRLMVFVVVIGIAAAAIIGSTGWYLWRDYQQDQDVREMADRPLQEIGLGPQAAGCDPVQEDTATGGGDHIPEPQPVQYNAAPPASGPHRPNWANFERKFYTVEDRPEVERLVHNLEHGYNILWYDETIANDEEALAQVEAIARTFENSQRDPKDAFIAAPWTSDDGPSFPEGKHIALTHWWANPQNPQEEPEKAIHRYCEGASGQVVAQFMEEYPQSEAREPGMAFL